MGYKKFMEPVPPRGSFQSTLRKTQFFYDMAEKGLSLCPHSIQRWDWPSTWTTQPWPGCSKGSE